MDNEKMLKQDNKFVKHIFWDPETKTCYPLYVTIENQQKIQNDKAFALKTFQQAKSVFLQNELSKEKQREKESSENIAVLERPTKRLKKQKESEPVKDVPNEIKNDIEGKNEIEKQKDAPIIEPAVVVVKTDSFKNIKREKKSEETKKQQVIEEPEFVNVKNIIDAATVKDDDDDDDDEMNNGEVETVQSYEDISEDNDKQTSQPRIKRKRKVYLRNPIQRPRRATTIDKLKAEKYNWNKNTTKALIRSYALHKPELDHHIKKKYFWTNIVKDLSLQNIRIDKDICQAKWNTLSRSYARFKETHQVPTNFPYYQLMNEILSDNKRKLLKITTPESPQQSKILKVESLNVENDSNFGNKNVQPRRVILMSQPIKNNNIQSSQVPTMPGNLSSITVATPIITQNSILSRRVSQNSRNFTLEDVERVVQNALETKLQRIFNAFQSTIDSLKSMSNSLNIRLTNNEDVVTEIKNKVQALESEFKSANVSLVNTNDKSSNNNHDSVPMTLQSPPPFKFTNQSITEQSNKKLKFVLIPAQKSMTDNLANRESLQVKNPADNSVKKVYKIFCSPPGTSQSSITTATNIQQCPFPVIRQLKNVMNFPAKPTP